MGKFDIIRLSLCLHVPIYICACPCRHEWARLTRVRSQDLEIMPHNVSETSGARSCGGVRNGAHEEILIVDQRQITGTECLSPRAACTSLRERPSWWPPSLLLKQIWYFCSTLFETVYPLGGASVTHQVLSAHQSKTDRFTVRVLSAHQSKPNGFTVRVLSTFNAKWLSCISIRFRQNEMCNSSFDFIKWIKWRRRVWIRKSLNETKDRTVLLILQWNFKNKSTGYIFHYLPTDLSSTFESFIWLTNDMNVWQQLCDEQNRSPWVHIGENGKSLRRRSRRLIEKSINECVIKRVELNRELKETPTQRWPPPDEVSHGEVHVTTHVYWRICDWCCRWTQSWIGNVIHIWLKVQHQYQYRW